MSWRHCAISPARALVIRDGQTVRVAGRDSGARRSSDARTGRSHRRRRDAARGAGFPGRRTLLTGESVPVRKRAATEGESDSADARRRRSAPGLFRVRSSLIGSGIARVTATVRAQPHRSDRPLSAAALDPETPHLRETRGSFGFCAIGGIAMALLSRGCSPGCSAAAGWRRALPASRIGMSLLRRNSRSC